MKKTISLCILASICTILFFSCSKKGDQVAPNISNSATLSPAQKNFLTYLDSKRPVHNYKEAWWWTVVKADLEGAGTGMALGGPALAWAGAALFSLMVGMPHYPATTSNPFTELTIDPINKGEYGNSSNPYDYEGVLHNIMLDSVTLNAPSYFVSGSTNSACNFNYNTIAGKMGSIYAANEGGTAAEFYDEVSLTILENQPILYYDTLPKYTSTEVYLYSTGKIDTFVYASLNSYISAMEGYTTYTDFYNYSVSVEKALASSEASTEDKKILYSAFSVGRYSAGFWMSTNLSGY